MDHSIETISNIGKDKSFVDDLNKKQGIVSMRVGLVLRSTEIKPLFPRFVHLYGLNPPPVVWWLLGLRCSGWLDDGGTVQSGR